MAHRRMMAHGSWLQYKWLISDRWRWVDDRKPLKWEVSSSADERMMTLLNRHSSSSCWFYPHILMFLIFVFLFLLHIPPFFNDDITMSQTLLDIVGWCQMPDARCQDRLRRHWSSRLIDDEPDESNDAWTMLMVERWDRTDGRTIKTKTHRKMKDDSSSRSNTPDDYDHDDGSSLRWSDLHSGRWLITIRISSGDVSSI